jgi:hypothetical protein|tara:strand:+ start:1959 stop:2357 length:399 start_codon:yes stop_codon:yes gene_type:complete
MSLTEDQIVTLELDESGEMRVKKLNRVVDVNDTGATDPESGEVIPDRVIKSVPHREILNPESADYQEKLSAISEKVVGQVAVQQQGELNKRQARIALLDDDCKKHLAIIKKLRSENTALKAKNTNLKAAVNG